MTQVGSLSPSSSNRKNSGFCPLDSSLVTDYWMSRFGVPSEAFRGMRFYRKAKSIWMMSDADLPGLNYETLGLRVLSLKEDPWKPTTCALQILGRYATKNFIDLGPEEATIFMAGESQEIGPQAEPGYVVGSHHGQVLGCGLYSRGRLASQIPKDRRVHCESCPEESQEAGDL